MKSKSDAIDFEPAEPFSGLKTADRNPCIRVIDDGGEDITLT
jgi:hypothetical protein